MFIYLLLNYVHVYGCQEICTCMQVFKEARGVRFPEDVATGYCGPHDMGAEN